MPMPFSMPNRTPGPMPKAPEKKPQIPPAANNLFGGKNTWRSFGEISPLVKKAPDKSIPGFDETLYQSGREKALGRLKGYTKKYLGKEEGLYPDELGHIENSSSVLGKLFNEANNARDKGRYDEERQLRKDIKTYEQWKKGF